jgi:hypothetical protein
VLRKGVVVFEGKISGPADKHKGCGGNEDEAAVKVYNPGLIGTFPAQKYPFEQVAPIPDKVKHNGKTESAGHEQGCNNHEQRIIVPESALQKADME